MNRYLAIHELPAAATRQELMESLTRVAEAAHARGLRPVETLYSWERHQAFTLMDAPGATQVREVLDDAGVGESEVLEVQRVYTELLDEPRRAR